MVIQANPRLSVEDSKENYQCNLWVKELNSHTEIYIFVLSLVTFSHENVINKINNSCRGPKCS